MNFSYMLSSCNDELFIYRDNQCYKKKKVVAKTRENDNKLKR